MKLVRRLFAAAVLLVGAGAAYAAVPFYTAWTIREAVKANDSAYLERKIAWTSVRATLKESLGKYAVNAAGDLAEPPANPTWWQRTKAYFGKGAIDRFVETTVTPTGLHAALQARKQYQATFETPEDPAKKPSAIERMRKLWSRVTRAVFTSAGRLELEMVDKFEPDRTIATVLELRDFEWIMTELRIRPTEKADAARLQLARN